MQPDELRHLGQLQRQAAELGALARDLAAAIPARVEGSDATGWVLVILGPDGIPAEIRVRDGWQQRLAPERLAGAVLDANSDAMRQAIRAWSDAVDDRGWWRRRADLNYIVSDELSAQANPADAEPPFGHVRDTTGLAEDVMRTLHDAQTSPATPPTSTEGRDDAKHVTVQIASGGLVGCTIDRDWAERNNGASISVALSVALRRAVNDYPRLPSADLEQDTLIGDALSTFNHLTANYHSKGGRR